MQLSSAATKLLAALTRSPARTRAMAFVLVLALPFSRAFGFGTILATTARQTERALGSLSRDHDKSGSNSYLSRGSQSSLMYMTQLTNTSHVPRLSVLDTTVTQEHPSHTLVESPAVQSLRINDAHYITLYMTTLTTTKDEKTLTVYGISPCWKTCVSKKKAMGKGTTRAPRAEGNPPVVASYDKN